MGSDLDDSAMSVDGGVDKDCVGVELVEHLGFIWVEEGGVEMEAGGVLLDEGLVGLHNRYEFSRVAPGEGAEEAGYVVVGEADDGDFDGGLLGGEAGCGRYEEEREESAHRGEG